MGHLLPAFLAARFSHDEFPLTRSAEFGFGLAHRLDSPSSGLVLAAGVHEGLRCLHAQLNMEIARREYFVSLAGAGASMRGGVHVSVALDYRRSEQKTTVSVTGKASGSSILWLAGFATATAC
eukprot:gnl/MRDRNA2_/MRDRNA2_21650_c0_seq1.p1 gnl/MRDRNA2_/MRDRNA2_21650_c0~~gnl/MRDRNA2_/MRDRNA2_21650_c0_seq1.p1  ORF type:complete len:135 (+),score=14.33 gnl/MRDRNA2_/MRDRNA2_21650_c0_seq1:39-407(+)